MDKPEVPTDSFYKFLTIAPLTLMIVCFFYLFREQATHRERFIDAQVELRAGGYQDGPAEPTTPEMRRAYFRREIARVGMQDVVKMASGLVGQTMIVSFYIALGFGGCWWFRQQRHDDEILRLTAAKMRREEAALR